MMDGHNHSFPKFDTFLQTTLGGGDFAQAAWQAAIEIAKADGLTAWNSVSGFLIDDRVDPKGWSLWENLTKRPEGLSSFLESAQLCGQLTMFRGTKLPDPCVGSFGFDAYGVHLTPWFEIAAGYAGAVNQEADWGVGRALRFQPSNPASSLGFLSAWKVPLNIHLWRNFEFERYVAGSSQMTTATASRMLQDMAVLLAGTSQKDFESYSGKYGIPSPVEKKIDDMRGVYYEAVADPSAMPDGLHLFTTTPDGERRLIRINPNNGLWCQWMARVQEAMLLDYYHLQPLERAAEALTLAKNLGKPVPEKFLSEVESALDLVRKSPWTYDPLSSGGIPKWAQQSRFVGSGTSRCPQYPPKVACVMRRVSAVFSGPSVG